MDLALEIGGFVAGLLYLWWEYHANPLMWLASVVMPAISLWLYFDKGLYADFGINIYYLAIALYGYLHWTRRGTGGEGHKKRTLPVSNVPGRVLGTCVGAFVALWGLLWWILTTFTDSNVPLWDAMTTALSIVALWMLARKYAQQWLAWLVVDAVCVGLYIYKGIYLYATLYGAYTVIAWLGYRKWRRMIPR